MKQWIRRAAALLAALMLVTAMPVTVFATEGFETENCLIVATEPAQTSPFAEFYKGTEKQPPEAMTWVEGGVHGQALLLNGEDEYLVLGHNQLRMAQMTFSTWINFKGAVDPTASGGATWQRLFTIHAGAGCYFTVSPHAQDSTLTNADGMLDGVYMEYFRGNEEEQVSMKSFTGAVADKSHFGIPQNEWHHMAVVVDNTNVMLYVDGNLILDELFLMPIVQMYADVMVIGGGLWGDPLLNAMLDDTFVFDKALTQQQIAALMQTGDIQSLKNPAVATTTENNYIPTTVPTTTAATLISEQPADKPYAPFGLPVWGYGVCIGVPALLILVTAAVNIYEVQRRNPLFINADDPMSEGEATEDEPEERFLTAAQRQKEQGNRQEGGADE